MTTAGPMSYPGVPKEATSATRGSLSQQHVHPVTGPDPPMCEVDACLL